MNKEEILKKVKNDIDYIPTLEELRLINDQDFPIGSDLVFKIVLSDFKDKELITSIEKDTRETRPDGLRELYDQLEAIGYCVTYNESRMHYIAYTLAEKNIQFVIEGFEYKQKLEKKRISINELQEQLGG